MIMNRFKKTKYHFSFLKIILLFSLFSILTISFISSANALFINNADPLNINIVGFNSLNNFVLNYSQNISGKVIVKKGVTASINYKIQEGDVKAINNDNQSYITYLSITMKAELDTYNDYVKDCIDSSFNEIKYPEGSYFAKNNNNKMNFVEQNNGSFIAGSNFPILREGLNATLNLTLSNECPIDSIVLDLNFSSLESSNYTYAYVVGSMNGWGFDEYYKMTPNIYASEFQWLWIGTLDIGVEFKATTGEDNWSSGGNFVVWDGANIKAIYWSGDPSDGVNINPPIY